MNLSPTTTSGSDSPEPSADKLSQNRFVMERVRAAILSGKLEPGARLSIATLAEEFAVSAGAVREALAMLEVEALVTSSPSRGYRVSSASVQDFGYLVEARIALEKLCLANAIAEGDLAWEGAIVAAFHQLKRARQMAQGDSFASVPSNFHTSFHRALVAGCNNPWLLRMYDMLYQQSERYRQLARSSATAATRDVEHEHQELMEAVLARDVARTHVLIERHLRATLEQATNRALQAE